MRRIARRWPTPKRRSARWHARPSASPTRAPSPVVPPESDRANENELRLDQTIVTFR
jgi:predicted P-loop ATPase